MKLRYVYLIFALLTLGLCGYFTLPYIISFIKDSQGKNYDNTVFLPDTPTEISYVNNSYKFQFLYDKKLDFDEAHFFDSNLKNDYEKQGALILYKAKRLAIENDSFGPPVIIAHSEQADVVQQEIKYSIEHIFFDIPFGRVEKLRGTYPNGEGIEYCKFYVRNPQKDYVIEVPCDEYKILSTLSDLPLSQQFLQPNYIPADISSYAQRLNSVATSTLQVYRNEKLGLQFSYPKIDFLFDLEFGEENWGGSKMTDLLLVNMMHSTMQRPSGILSVVSTSSWGKIEKSNQQLIDEPKIKATKKVFEKPYGTVTSIEGVTGRDGDTFCDWYIKNPTKDYVVIISCDRTPLLDSLTFF